MNDPSVGGEKNRPATRDNALPVYRIVWAVLLSRPTLRQVELTQISPEMDSSIRDPHMVLVDAYA
jgi:hypothetical protein